MVFQSRAEPLLSSNGTVSSRMTTVFFDRENVTMSGLKSCCCYFNRELQLLFEVKENLPIICLKKDSLRRKGPAGVSLFEGGFHRDIQS